MTYNEYLNMVDLADSREELESILKKVENDEELSSRKYYSLRNYIIDKIYK